MPRISSKFIQQDEAVQSVTALGENAEDERKKRMIKYTIAMTIRVICLVLGMFVQGWLMWLCFAAAIFLPYIAVIIANDVKVEAGEGISAVTDKNTVPAQPLRIDASTIKIVDTQTKPEAGE